MTKSDNLAQLLVTHFPDAFVSITTALNEVTVECQFDQLILSLRQLRDNSLFAFDQLIDLCAVDYLLYGIYDWETNSASEKGFSRGVERKENDGQRPAESRYAVVYHLLSTSLNHRLRVKVFIDEAKMIVPTAHHIWKGANWFEREAYDLYGILFEGHPDLRRILTDYGFIGHPFRKDFPLSGHVEMRYDAASQKVIYEPVTIEPRISVPKVIRKDNRYSHILEETAS